MELNTDGIQELIISFFTGLFNLNFETMDLTWVNQLYELAIPFARYGLQLVGWLK